LNLMSQTQAGNGVDDVRIARPAYLDVLFGVARRGYASVVKQDRARVVVGKSVHSGDGHFPAALSWRRIPNGNVSAGRDQSTGKSPALQDRQRLFGRVALGDPPEVQAHVWHEQSNGLFPSIQTDLLVSDRGRGGCDFGRRWEDLLLAGKPPQPHERPYRHVKGAIGKRRKSLCLFEHVKQVRT